MSDVLQAVYADDFDGSVVNPVSRAEAEARDAAGRPYAVLLLDGDRPALLVRVSWVDGYCGVLRYDAGGRRTAAYELRRAPGGGELFLRWSRTWDGPDDGGHRRTVEYTLAGRRTDRDEPQGARGSRSDVFSREAPPRLAQPGPGCWEALLALVGDAGRAVSDAAGHDLPVVTREPPVWQPPRPAAPRDPAGLCTDGSQRSIGGGRRRARIGVRRAGELALPSGRVVAADPTSLEFDDEPFTVAVAPGTYPVTVSTAYPLDEPGRARVAAARLEVADRPVAGWEMALLGGQHVQDLGDGEFYGIGVDAGMACFTDADACAAVAGRFDTEGWDVLDSRIGRDGATVLPGGTLVAWSSGWGDGAYPVWIGRDAGGGVVCYLADMLL